VLIAVAPFLGLFFLWVAFFATISIILGSNKANAEGFTGTITAVGYFLQTFENSLGNISNPSIDFEKKSDSDNILDKVIFVLIYAFWFAAQILLLIVFLNYVIALISQYYEDVMNSKVEHVYTMKE